MKTTILQLFWSFGLSLEFSKQTVLAREKEEWDYYQSPVFDPQTGKCRNFESDCVPHGIIGKDAAWGGGGFIFIREIKVF